MERVPLAGSLATKLDNLTSSGSGGGHQSQSQSHLQPHQKEPRSSNDNIDIFATETREVTPDSPISQVLECGSVQAVPLNGFHAKIISISFVFEFPFSHFALHEFFPFF